MFEILFVGFIIIFFCLGQILRVSVIKKFKTQFFLHIVNTWYEKQCIAKNIKVQEIVFLKFLDSPFHDALSLFKKSDTTSSHDS